MTTESKLNAFMGTIDDEQAQESRVDAHEGSYFEGAPDDEIVRERAREFDDLPKHVVRSRLWLKTVRKIFKEQGSKGLRLLTLPGRHRLEVEFYAKHNLLGSGVRDGIPYLHVVGFEQEPTVYGLLQSRTPSLQSLFRGSILAALVEPNSENGLALRALAPFDVINLDLTANIAARSDGPFSPFMQAVRQCLQIQGSRAARWALMVTFRAGMSDNDPVAVEVLEKFFQENIDKHVLVKDKCLERYKSKEAKKLLEEHPEEGLGQITAKWVIEQGHQADWQCDYYRHAAYTREFTKKGTKLTYSLRKLVFEFVKRPPTNHEIVLNHVPTKAWHLEDLARLFEPAAMLDVDDAVARMPEQERMRLEQEIFELQNAEILEHAAATNLGDIPPADGELSA